MSDVIYFVMVACVFANAVGLGLVCITAASNWSRKRSEGR
jgi:hypothetical protein